MFFRRKIVLPFEREYFQTILSGSGAGIATTTAIIIGLAVANEDITAITTSAIVIIFIQAFNSAGSKYSDTRTSQEIDGEIEEKPKLPLIAAMIQFTSHLSFGLLALVPLILLGVDDGVIWSAILNVVVLTLISLYKVTYVKDHALADGIEFVLTGILVMLVGLGAGLLLEFYNY